MINHFESLFGDMEAGAQKYTNVSSSQALHNAVVEGANDSIVAGPGIVHKASDAIVDAASQCYRALSGFAGKRDVELAGTAALTLGIVVLAGADALAVAAKEVSVSAASLPEVAVQDLAAGVPLSETDVPDVWGGTSFAAPQYKFGPITEQAYIRNRINQEAFQPIRSSEDPPLDIYDRIDKAVKNLDLNRPGGA